MKTLFILASMIVALFIAAPTKIEAKNKRIDNCAFCGTWEYVGSFTQDMPFKSYLKISRAGKDKFTIIESYYDSIDGKIKWGVRTKDIYLKFLNGKLVGRFVTDNFLYSTGGSKTTYKITCELTTNNKMRYSVWSAIRGGKPLKFVGTKISQ